MLIDVYVLAGGKSTRMGTDKGLLRLANRPMIAYVLDAVKHCPQTYLITSNPLYVQFRRPMLNDIIPHLGAIGGLYTALHHAKRQGKPAIFLCSCDIPLLSEAVTHQLYQHYQHCQCAVIPRHGSYLHPLCAIFPIDILPIVENQISQKNYKMMTLIEKITAEMPNFTHRFTPNPFTNCNTTVEVEDILKYLNT